MIPGIWPGRWIQMAGVLDGAQPVAAPYDGAIAAWLARTDSDQRMKNWQHVLWADLGLAIVFALFMFVFFDDAVSKVFGGAAGLVMGAIAGVLTFLGGARIAFRIAHELRVSHRRASRTRRGPVLPIASDRTIRAAPRRSVSRF